MEELQRKRLIRQRAIAQRSLTCLQTYITKDERKIHDLRIRYEELPDILTKFEAAQTQLELEDDADHFPDRETFKEQYFQVKSRFMELLYVNRPSSPNEADNVSDRGSNVGYTHSSTVHIKLPPIALPSFNGDHCQWLNYKDTFEALIINNTALSNVQRFHYLAASLKHEPKQLIANLAITNDNFFVAWNLIVERYNNVKLLAIKHVELLMQMPHAKKGDASSLRNVINHFSSNYNAVEALQLTTNMQSLMSTHLLLSALDPDTRKAWELRTASQEDIPTKTELLTVMEQRCKALELLPGQLSTNSTSRDKHHPANDKVSRTARTYMTTHNQCLMCKQSHRLLQCDKFLHMSPQARMHWARQHKLCYNCLKVYNKDHVCSTFMCRKCGKRHHTLLHMTAPSQPADHDSRTSSKSASNRSASPVTTYCSVKRQTSTHVLLATAVVEIQTKHKQYVPCRVVLDGASQLNFISEGCVKRLGFSKQTNSTFIQRINQINTSTQCGVLVNLRSNYTDWKTTISCSVLPKITETTPTHKLDISSWKIPSKLQLADPAFNQPGPNDLLMGAELFYDLLLADRQTRPGYPILQETVLGWFISDTTPVQTTSTHKHKAFFIQDASTLESNLNRFWDLEQVEPISTPEHTACEQHFVKHARQRSNGRFEVRLPLNRETMELGFSR
jgi:hypothetical protein